MHQNAGSSIQNVQNVANNTEKESIELQNAVNTLGRNSFQLRNAGNSIQNVSNPESKKNSPNAKKKIPKQFPTLFYFPRNIGSLIIPIDVHIFQRGGQKPPTRDGFPFFLGLKNYPFGARHVRRCDGAGLEALRVDKIMSGSDIGAFGNIKGVEMSKTGWWLSHPSEKY